MKVGVYFVLFETQGQWGHGLCHMKALEETIERLKDLPF